jgi:HEPN domain-containing protein
VRSEASRADLQRLAEEKLADAKHLLADGRWANAYYLAGYAVELALKACIAKTFKAETIPDKALVNATYSHNFTNLVGTAELTADLNNRKAAEAFEINWGVAVQWSEESRYESKGEQEAKDLIAAIEDATDGVLVWIKAHG